MLNMIWTTEDDGDETLSVNGAHFGVVCPHRLPDGPVVIVWDWGQKRHISRSVQRAKMFLEAVASKEARIEQFREEQEAIQDPW